MSPARKSPSSNPPATERRLEPYVENHDERSEIRRRVVRASSTKVHARDESSANTRAARLEMKVSFAKVVLDDVDPYADRARLLRAAIVRRDETLLDALLGIGSPPELVD